MEKIVWDNGLQMLLLPRPENECRVFTLDVYVTVGARYEAGYHEGIAHLAEHMVFKGTERRNSLDISLAMDDLGGAINAYTGQEHTRYYVKTLGEYSMQALDLLSDMLLCSSVPQRELELEQQVVLEEIAMYEDYPEEVAHDALLALVWQGHPLSSAISGTRESVSAIDREELCRFLRENYVPNRMLIVCAGCFDREELLTAVGQTFGGRPEGTEQPEQSSPVFHGGLTLRQKDNEQVCMELGFPGVPAGAKERFALSLLIGLLGDGDSSRLYQRLREELGLVYGVYATHYACRGGGLFTVAAATVPENQLTVLREIGKVLGELSEHGVTEEELCRARKKAKTFFLMNLETVGAVAARAGRDQLLYGRSVPVDEVLASWEAVTVGDVNALAKRLLSACPAFSAVGPVAEESAFREILEGFSYDRN